jgi:hypothetical protein
MDSFAPVRRLVVAALCSTAVLASQKVGRSGTSVLSGRVVDAQTDAPIAGAKLSLVETGFRPPHDERLEWTKSDASGGFEFDDLPAGAHYVWVFAEGCLDGASAR